jgi:hypothetical protein
VTAAFLLFLRKDILCFLSSSIGVNYEAAHPGEPAARYILAMYKNSDIWRREGKGCQRRQLAELLPGLSIRGAEELAPALDSGAEVDDRRVLRWLFGRAASEPRDHWAGDWKLELARKLSF